jgi:hypothetical protein
LLFSLSLLFLLKFLYILHSFWFCRPCCCNSFKLLVDPLNSLFFMWAAGCLLGTKIDCPIARTLESVSTLTPAAVHFYCTYSSTVSEVAYTNGAVLLHVTFVPRSLAVVTEWLSCCITTIFHGQLVDVVDVDNCHLKWACCCYFQHVNFACYERVLRTSLCRCQQCNLLGTRAESREKRVVGYILNNTCIVYLLTLSSVVSVLGT